MTTITIEREDDRFVITDEETKVTTQGETKVESLLMSLLAAKTLMTTR